MERPIRRLFGPGLQPTKNMIANHPRFLEAIRDRKKVSVRFYSKPDSGVIDRVCAPMDYGPGIGTTDGLNRYWLWDCSGKGNPGSQPLGLLPQEIVDLQVLGDLFDPADFGDAAWPWAVTRDWGAAG